MCGNLGSLCVQLCIEFQHSNDDTCMNMEKPLRVARRATMVSENTCHKPTNSEPKRTEEKEIKR